MAIEKNPGVGGSWQVAIGRDSIDELPFDAFFADKREPWVGEGESQVRPSYIRLAAHLFDSPPLQYLFVAYL